MDCSSPGLPAFHCLQEFSQTHVHWVSDAIQPSCPLLPPSPPALNFSFLASGCFLMSQLFASGGQGIGVRFSISPSNKYSGLISFRMDWLDLLAVQVSLKSLLQDHSLKASVLQHSVFFMVQLSHPYMTTGKTIALSTGTFVSKRISPFFNTQSHFGALGKRRAFSERSFQGKLPGGLERQWEWWAQPDPQMEGLRESTVSWTGDLYTELREPETSP